MEALVILIIIEVLSIIVLKEYYYDSSRAKFYLFLSFHICLSIWFWYLLIKVTVYQGYYDEPDNIQTHMNLTGMIIGVVIPRFLIIAAHFAGKLIRIRKREYISWLTRSGIVFSSIIFVVIAYGTMVGRFNFKTEEITIKYKDLPAGLVGIRIVHLSDMHLACFHKYPDKLEDVVEKVNALHPDLIINTGDYVNYGWREFDRCDTILIKAKSRFGNYAVLGNHDLGTYLPDSLETEKEFNIMMNSELIISSGSKLLKDEHIITDINGVKVAFIGVITGGRHPGITHGNLAKASAGTDSADFKILLAHDPNQWEEDVSGKTDIDLTLSGHTHGMQIGILTKRFRWSPAKYFYPNWHGLYRNGDQALYVNRGLGVLAIPFRIWMPPEITVITLESG